jgi:hypothetical protein
MLCYNAPEPPAEDFMINPFSITLEEGDDGDGEEEKRMVIVMVVSEREIRPE